MEGELCIMVCESHLKEATMVRDLGEFTGVQIVAFPGTCSQQGLSWDDIDEILTENNCLTGNVALLSGCCTHQIEVPPTEARRIIIPKLSQCFELFTGLDIVNKYLQEGSYLVTPGWLKSWQTSMNQWGFDEHSAKGFFGESTRKITLLDTGVEADSLTALMAFADFVGHKNFEQVFVGIDHLRLLMGKLVSDCRLEEQNEKLKALSLEANKKQADFSMVSDLIAGLADEISEDTAISKIFELFLMLFAPQRVLYLPLYGEEKGRISSVNSLASEEDEALILVAADSLKEEYTWTKEGDGFLLRVQHRNENVGVLLVAGLTFDKYKNHYLDLALTINKVCGLAIANARKYQLLKKNERKIKRYAKDLEKANNDVKQFAYIISHDLRAPLVNIQGFSTELKYAIEDIEGVLEKIQGDLDSEQQAIVANALKQEIPEAFQFIGSSVNRMENYISSLLKLSRLGRHTLKPESVNLQKIVEAVADDLSHEISQREGQLFFADLPTIIADRVSVEQILGNLISNAIKYWNPDLPLKIKIWTEADDFETRIYVQDNGLGIANNELDRIFAPFRRAGQQSVPGEGMGLAYVQTILQRHGGAIQCDSILGKGTTFSLSLPHQELAKDLKFNE